MAFIYILDFGLWPSGVFFSFSASNLILWGNLKPGFADRPTHRVKSCHKKPKLPYTNRSHGVPGSAMNSILFEAWMSCSGNWKQSKFLLSIRSRESHKIKGVRKWFTRAELRTKFGDGPAEDMITRKRNDAELAQSEIRKHPDLPNSEETCLLRVL